MIWESQYWKEDLLRYAGALQDKTKHKVWRESSGVVVEKTVFLGFYSIRKLLEAKKLSTSFESLTIPALIYRPTAKTVTRMNWHRTEELYDTEKPKRIRLGLPYLANQVIHSFIFHHGVNEKGGLSFILLASDRQRAKGLYQISIQQVISVFRRVGKNYPWRGEWHRDAKTGEYKCSKNENGAQPAVTAQRDC
jgi:hypothetical protein